MAKLDAKDKYIRVVEVYDDGNRSIREVASSTGIPIRTVERYLSKYKKAVPVEEVQNQGRPQKLSDDDIKCITVLLSEKPFLSSKDLSNELKLRRNIKVTHATVRNHLHRIKYKNSRPRDVPMLTEAAKEKRVRFATENASAVWENVFFRTKKR